VAAVAVLLPNELCHPVRCSRRMNTLYYATWLSWRDIITPAHIALSLLRAALVLLLLKNCCNCLYTNTMLCLSQG